MECRNSFRKTNTNKQIFLKEFETIEISEVIIKAKGSFNIKY